MELKCRCFLSGREAACTPPHDLLARCVDRCSRHIRPVRRGAYTYVVSQNFTKRKVCFIPSRFTCLLCFRPPRASCRLPRSSSPVSLSSWQDRRSWREGENSRRRFVPCRQNSDRISSDPTRRDRDRFVAHQAILACPLPNPAHIVTAENHSPRAIRPPYPTAVSSPGDRQHRPAAALGWWWSSIKMGTLSVPPDFSFASSSTPENTALCGTGGALLYQIYPPR